MVSKRDTVPCSLGWGLHAGGEARFESRNHTNKSLITLCTSRYTVQSDCACPTLQDKRPRLSQGLGICLFRVLGESFSRFNNGIHLLQREEGTTHDKEGGDREGEDQEHVTGASTCKGPVLRGSRAQGGQWWTQAEAGTVHGATESLESSHSQYIKTTTNIEMNIGCH